MEARLNRQRSRRGAGTVCPPGYKWWVVFMLWFICFFNYADRQSIFSVFPKLEEQFRFDKVELGLIGSAFMWVYAFGAPLAGYVGDRVRRKDLILGGCLFWSGITVLTGFCGKLWQFVTVRALEGLGETFYFPASMSLLSDYHGPGTRSRAMSLHQSSVYIGTIGGSWLGAWFAERNGWPLSFFFFGSVGMFLALMLYWFLREPVRGAAENNVDHEFAALSNKGPRVAELARAIFARPLAGVLMLVFLGANFVATIFLTWTPTFLVEKFHFKLTSAGLSGSVFIHLASAVSVPLGGWLADRLSRRLAGGRMLVQGLGLLVGSIFVFFVGTTQRVSVLLWAMAAFGFAKGLYDSNIFAALYDQVPPEARATAAGLMNTVGWGGGALGPLAIGWMAQHGPHPTEMENMSLGIAWCSVIYLAGAAGLFMAVLAAANSNALSRSSSGT
jgi:MFS family permease